MKRVAASAAVLGLLLFFSDPAEACSPACGVAKLAPAAGAAVPASAPGFLLVGPSAETTSVQLLDGSGAVVAGSFKLDSASGRTYFAPSSALTPGSHATRGPMSCGSSDTVDVAFTVTASAAFPTSTGSLTVRKVGREMLSASTNSGSCTEPVDAGYVDLEIAIDPALDPYLDIATWQTKVDGKWWSQKDPIGSAIAPEGNARSYLRLFTACDGKTTAGGDQGLAAGKHEVEVRAFLPGGASLAPAKLIVDVSCDDVIVGDGEIPGTGAGNGGSESDFSGSDTGARGRPANASPTTAYRSSGDGCSAAPNAPHATNASSTSTTASITTALVALLGVAGLRRRRSGELD